MNTHKKQNIFMILAALLLAASVAFGPVHRVQAQSTTGSCTVTSTADDDSAGTLRTLLANETCTAINFSGDMTINLSSELTITHAVTIDGGTNAVTISGDSDGDDAGETRIFFLEQGVTATIQNLTLDKAYAYWGSAILNWGTLTVVNSAVTSSSGSSAIYNEGTLVVKGSEFADNTAGAIYSSYLYDGTGDASLTVEDSLFTRNRGVSGSAILSSDLTLTNSVFIGNISSSGSGAVVITAGGKASVTGCTFDGNQGYYGGAIVAGGTTDVSGSTFSNNVALYVGGAIYNSGGTLTVTNSTFYKNSITPSDKLTEYNGSAIYGGALVLKNSTLVGNSGYLEAGTIASNSISVYNSLFSDNKTIDCFGTHSGSHNISSQQNESFCDGTIFGTWDADELLLGKDLGDYGGATQTVPLLPGSPAINAGDSAYCPTTDQRGVDRPPEGGCDVGAFQSQGFTLTASSGDNQAAFLGDEFLYPLEVTVTSNAVPAEPIDYGRVTFSAPASDASALLTYRDIGPQDTINATIIEGKASVLAAANQTAGSYLVTASAAGAQDIPFNLTNTDLCESTQTVTSNADIGPGTLRNAIAFACAGGTITFDGDKTILLDRNLVVSRDMTIDGGTNTVIISRDNTSDSDSIGFGDSDTRLMKVINSATLNLNHLTFEKGWANYDTGAGYYIEGEGAGGAIYVSAGTLNVTDSIFADNASYYSGGAIYVKDGTLTVSGSTFEGNWSLAGSGGAIGSIGSMGTLAVTGSTFEGNESDSGGAIWIYDGKLTVAGSTFTNNNASKWAGAIYTYGNTAGTASVTNSTFVGNSAPEGGAIYNYSDLLLTNSTFVENSASSEGGALYNDGHSMVVSNSLFKGNTGGTCGFYGEETHSGNTNLADDATCGDGFTQSSQILLGTLGDYGGSTQTVPLLPGSAAIDAGNDSLCPEADQRGVMRPQGPHCDIGAYENAQPLLDSIIFYPEPSLAGYPMIYMRIDFLGMVNYQYGGVPIPYACTVNYGDGTVEDGEVMSSDGRYEYTCSGNENYTYSTEGNYEVTFTIKDLEGNPLANFTAQHRVIMPNRGYIDWSPKPVIPNQDVAFTTYVNGYDSYLWVVFPQGYIYQGQTSEIRFDETGTHKVMLITWGPGMPILVDGVEVEVVAPAPVLSGINPTSAQPSMNDLTLIVTGVNFTPDSVVRWNGENLETTFGSDTQLSAVIPAASLAAVQTAQVTVFTPAPGGGTSNVLAFFVTESQAIVTDQEVASGTDPSATVTPATATATGDGLLVVAEYDANPGGITSFSASDTYFDVYTAPDNNFSQVEIVACNLGANDKLFWWDPKQSMWEKASPQSYSDGCITLVVDANSSPTLSQLQGTVFAVGVEPNTAPLADPGGPYLAAINTAIAFDGSLSTDPDGDALTYAWDFGDGGSGTGATPTHSYTAVGIFNVCLTVNDGALDSEPACTLAVVYDPSAGFVTGGGWIDSQPGAYIPDPGLSGKATFGFVSKYKKGASVPEGTTEFQFQAGAFNFHSTAYEWLLISKDKLTAQFKGSGTINGALAPNGDVYKFMLWAGDGSSPDGSDTFRIKIWWEDAEAVEHVVYDNGFDQAISGGSIIVHVSK